MFNFFRRRTAKEFIEEANATYGLPKPVEYPVMPETKKKPNQEYYRVGATPDGNTTLTLMGDNGFSMTLTLNQSGCEQMIRMIRSTYTPEEEYGIDSN